MKSAKVKKIVLAGISLGLIAVMSIAGTVAYLQGSTEDVVNTFSTNGVTVELSESSGQSYNIIPGTFETKDPKVTVTATVDAYVFVTINDKSGGVVKYEVADGWTLYRASSTAPVYYREVKAGTTP